MQREYTKLIKKYAHLSLDVAHNYWRPAAAVGGVAIGIWTLWLLRKYRQFKEEVNLRLQALSSTLTIGVDTIQYATYGDGDYPILILHGTPGGFDQGLWTAQALASASSPYSFVPVEEDVDRLKSKVTFIAVSRPGYLNSSVSDKTSQVTEYSKMLRELVLKIINERNLKTKVMVLGLSGGGPHAAAFARANSDICSQLVMISAVSKPLEAFKTMSNLAKKINTWIFRHDSFGNVLVFLLKHFPSTLPRLLPIKREREFLKTVPGAMDQMSGLLQNGMCFTSRRVEGWHADVALVNSLEGVPMNDITVPTLVMHGTEDKNCPVENAYHSATVPNSKLKLFPGYGHLILPSFHYLRNFILEKVMESE